jgi:hypothetical protein
MSEAEQLLSWLNSRTNCELSALNDQRISRQICYYLVGVAGKPEVAQKITIGKNPFERSTNFQIAKSLMGLMDCPFTFNLAKLVDGDSAEMVALLRALSALDGRADDCDLSLDELLEALNDDLTAKLAELLEFQGEMDTIARERDFYFDKLKRILEAAGTFPPATVEHVTNIIEVSPKDF